MKLTNTKKTSNQKVRINLKSTLALFVLAAMVIMSSFRPIADKPQVQGKEVPFKAVLTTRIQIMGAPPIQPVRSFGSGVASHMGKTTFEANAVVNFTMQPPQISGTATFTAANGDTFTTEYSGTTSPNGDGTVSGSFTHIITGGTGRFSSISGTITAVSLHQLSTNTGTLEFDGMISY